MVWGLLNQLPILGCVLWTDPSYLLPTVEHGHARGGRNSPMCLGESIVVLEEGLGSGCAHIHLGQWTGREV